MEVYYPGTRLVVFDPHLFKDDRKTPLAVTMQPATVTRWYGRPRSRAGGCELGPYPSLVDVIFDHDGRESFGHFADAVYVEKIAE